MNSKINLLHERYLHIVYNDKATSFDDFFSRTDPSISTSIALVLLDWSKETSGGFLALR